MPSQNPIVRLRWNERQRDALAGVMEAHKKKCRGRGCKACARYARQLKSLEIEAAYIRREFKP